MNTENILCGNYEQVPGDQARVRNYTCSDASLGEKIDILLSRLVTQLKGSQDLRDHKLTFWVTCLAVYHGREQPGHNQISPRQSGQVSALRSQLTK